MTALTLDGSSIRSLAIITLLLVPISTQADEPSIIDSMDELHFHAAPGLGITTLVQGRTGKAVLFHFNKNKQGGFATSNIHGTPQWDRSAGFSFWAKGNASDQLVGIQFIFDDDFAVRYDFAFFIKGNEWEKQTVAWQDLIPILPGPKAKPLLPKGGNPPSKLSALWIGRWWYWGDYPELTVTIDDLRLEQTIVRDSKPYQPEAPPLARVVNKLKSGKPITIVTMGDSLTDKRHWANREVCWVDLLRERLSDRYNSRITIVNPAIGGTQLRQNVVLVPRWRNQYDVPDLVTIFFGYNDWDGGMRGEEFTQVCEEAIDRVRRVTGGKADILLMTSNPSIDRWDSMSELAEACRKAAHKKNVGLADTDKAFHQAGLKNRERLFVHDRVHLSKAGHELVTDVILRQLGAE